MTEPLDDRPPRRSLRRDADVRAVSRVTWGIAAAAIAGTVVVGGLAAGGVSSQAAADGNATSATATPAPSDGTAPIAAGADAAPGTTFYDDDYYRSDDDGRRSAQSPDGLQPPQSAPAPSFQPPAASSGGS